VSISQLWIDENSQVGEERATYDVNIPIVGMVGAAGIDVPLYTDGDYPVGVGMDVVRVPLNDPECFALVVRGNSMEPIYFDGTTVVINPRVSFVRGGTEIRPIINGRAYYVRDLDERRYVKLVRRLNGTYILSSASTAYDPIVLPAGSVVDIFGIVMTIQASH
jgi:phage repressor protein C with HTH and peptisase S24 domain